MDPIQTNKKSRLGLIAGFVALVLVAGGALFVFKNIGNGNLALDNDGDDAPVNTAPAVPPATTPADVAPSSKYKNGTYSADGFYSSPGGNDVVHVTLTLKNGIVTDAVVTAGDVDRTSLRYQQAFMSGYKAYVIGKSIDSIKLTKVSGSSLTPSGFNDAVAKIKVSAKA
jgi:hypothetical protein